MFCILTKNYLVVERSVALSLRPFSSDFFIYLEGKKRWHYLEGFISGWLKRVLELEVDRLVCRHAF